MNENHAIIKDIKNIHLVGIKGVGMTALAQILAKNGHNITGSDTTETFFTDQVLKDADIIVREGFKKENITKEIQLIIHSTAYNPKTHPKI
ncbi:MAG: hypothetical protein KC736_04035, partial [Candidatus Moranbacteria bacterium]|nr:hypothetical protein [Candidatus Moranbacteria bacterium]